MRVLHLMGSTADSRYFATLIPALTNRGLEVECVTLNSASAPAWLATANRATHFTLSARPGLGPWLLSAACRLAGKMRRDGIDVVQTHLFEPAIVGVLAAKIAGVPVLVTRHHTDEMEIVGTRLHQWIDRALTHSATGLVGFAQAVRSYLVERERADADKVYVVPQGFRFAELRPDPRRVEALRAKLDLSARFVIGDVARWSVTKDQRTLVRAAQILTQRIGDLAVLLVGVRPGPDVDAMIEAEGMAGRVKVLEYLDDVATAFGAMDVVAHPSLTEAFCQVIVEAMAAERVVVASNVAAAPEVIEDGRTGFLVQPRDPHALAAAIERLHQDGTLRAGVAAAGRRSVEGRFTVERMVRAQLGVYEDILADSRRRC